MVGLARTVAKRMIARLGLACDQAWSIGVLAGDSPERLDAPASAPNPVLTPQDVTDVDASSVADPFVIRRRDAFAMFFEILGREDRKGRIGLARSDDGLRWTYDCVVLEEPFHLSYPLVLAWKGDVLMLPESHQSGRVTLYAADPFPTAWRPCATLLEGAYVDCTLFLSGSVWWLFACETGHDVLRLYRAEEPHGPFAEHPMSPIVAGDPHRARPAGRLRPLDGRLHRVSQDCHPTYGLAVDLWEIAELTVDHYAEVHRRRILRRGGWGWRRNGMHHIDALEVEPGRWLAWVDGWRRQWSVRRRMEHP